MSELPDFHRNGPPGLLTLERLQGFQYGKDYQGSQDASMDGELDARTGTETQNIRYYEREGLIPQPSRRSNGYRAFGKTHLERLAFIRHCRALDMSLADIRTLLHFISHPRESCDDVDRLVEDQLGRVKARLKSMRALERQLIALRAQCAAASPARTCGIPRELLVAAHGEAMCLPSRAGTDANEADRREVSTWFT